MRQCLNLKWWGALLRRIWHEIAGWSYKLSVLLVLFLSQTVFGQNPGPTTIFNSLVASLESGNSDGSATSAGFEFIDIPKAPITLFLSSKDSTSCSLTIRAIFPLPVPSLIERGKYLSVQCGNPDKAGLTPIIASASVYGRTSIMSVSQPAHWNPNSIPCAITHEFSSFGGYRISTFIFGLSFKALEKSNPEDSVLYSSEKRIVVLLRVVSAALRSSSFFKLTLRSSFPSQIEMPNPSTISAMTPQKTHFCPQWDFRADDLKSSTSRNFGFSLNDSKYNPHATAPAPSEAKMEMRKTMVIYFLVTGIPFLCFVLFALFCGWKIHKNINGKN